MKDNLKAVRLVQEYIEKNLTRPITLFELGRVCGYSLFYLERIFKDATGVRLFDYIRKLRLTEAAKILREGKSKVIDTALDFTFDSHEGFTRAFSKQFGVSPYKYSKNPLPVSYFIAYKVLPEPFSKKMNEEREKVQTKFIFTQIIERPKRKAIIKRGKVASDYFSYCEEVGCDVWGVLTSVKEALYEPVGFWLSDNLIKPNTSKYVQGVEVPQNYSGAVPQGFELIELKPCSYLVFNGPSYDDDNFMTEVGAVMDAVENFNPEVYGYEWDEGAPRFQLEPRGDRGYIEASPVRKIMG